MDLNYLMPAFVCPIDHRLNMKITENMSLPTVDAAIAAGVQLAVARESGRAEKNQSISFLIFFVRLFATPCVWVRLPAS
jgi:hypothetical protein